MVMFIFKKISKSKIPQNMKKLLKNSNFIFIGENIKLTRQIMIKINTIDTESKKKLTKMIIKIQFHVYRRGYNTYVLVYIIKLTPQVLNLKSIWAYLFSKKISKSKIPQN